MRRPVKASVARMADGRIDPERLALELERVAAFLAGVAAGLHPATREGSFTVRSDERLLLLGPQTTPFGVTLTVESGGVMQTL